MDGHRFDEVTKKLTVLSSRRGVLRRLLGGAVGSVAAIRSRGGSAADKVVICHLTGSLTNPVVQIEVSVNAIPAHEAHGDVIGPDFENDPANCGGCLVSCDDGDPCTTDTCEGGVCVNTPIDCSASSDQCNVGVCVDGACVPKPVADGTACDDGDACTAGETCQNGECTGGGDISCNDGDVCTEDRCDPDSGCVNTPIPNCCHNDDECPRGQVCLDNRCTDNPNPECQGETCDTFTGCSPSNPDCVCTTVVGGGGLCVPGSTPCADLSTCPTGTECPAGALCVEASCCGENVCVPIILNEQCPAAAGITVVTTSVVASAGPTIGGR